jgi:hypothetical protein
MSARGGSAWLSLTLLIACGSGEDREGGAAGMGAGMPVAPGSATFSAIYAEIIVAKGCSSGSFCHGGPGGGLTMSEQQAAYDGLVGARAMGGSPMPPHCRDLGLMRVVPGAPEQSLLVLKIEGRQPCGMPMPPNPPLLDPADVTRIRTWIANGAAND